MSILSKLMGTTQGTARGSAARSTRAGGRSTTGKGMGGGLGGRSTGRGTTGRSFKGFSKRGQLSAGRGKAAPASSGGISKLLGSFTKRS